MEGYETIWANDFAEWACKSFSANFGKVIHCKDITQIDSYTDPGIPGCDIVLGGFPCQDFSIIWKQPGLNGARGGLFRHFAEFVDAKKPKAFVAGGGGTWGYHYPEPRPLTNRERARLQSFPDDFVFKGSITEVWRQIRNAVPPVGVRVVARRLLPLFTVEYDPVDLLPEYEKMKAMPVKQRLEYVTAQIN